MVDELEWALVESVVALVPALVVVTAKWQSRLTRVADEMFDGVVVVVEPGKYAATT